MSRNKAIVLLTFGSFILLAISVGAIVFMSDFLMGRTFQNIGWLIVLLIPIKLAVCIIMLKFEIRAAYSLSTIYSGRGWLSRRLFCLCTAAPAMTMWLAALFAAAALAGNGAVPRNGSVSGACRKRSRSAESPRNCHRRACVYCIVFISSGLQMYCK